MQWRLGVTRRNSTGWITSKESAHPQLLWTSWVANDALRILPPSSWHRLQYNHTDRRYYNDGIMNFHRNTRNLMHHRHSPKRKHLEVLMASFASSSSSDSSSNLSNDATTSYTHTSSPFTSSNSLSSIQNNDSPRLTLHMQRMQQQELRRQYVRKNRSNGNSKNSYNNPAVITKTPQPQVQPSRIDQELAENSTTISSINSITGINSSTLKDEQQAQQPPKFATPEEVKIIINDLYRQLAQIFLETNTEASESNGSKIDDTAQMNIQYEPLWDVATQQQHPPYVPDNDVNYVTMLNHQRDLFLQTIKLQQTLYDYVNHQKIIRPGTLHRHEFVALVGLILQIYSHLPASVAISTADTNLDTSMTAISTAAAAAGTATKPITLFTQSLELIDWIRGPPYRLELSHKQCHAVIMVAAKCQQWTTAAQIYMEHIDPEMAGYIPVPINTISARSFTTDGLFCIAYSAILNQTLPVENVFDGVTKLMIVSPSDTENYVLSAGVALGHAGEWDALRDYLKSSYKASRLGQPLVAATMHSCVLCGRYQDAIDIFDDLVKGELASAAEWQWEGTKDVLHPACRDLAIRALGELKTIHNADEIKQRIMELYNEARQAEAKVSVEALYAVVSAWDDDLETVMNLVLPLLQTGFISRLVLGDDTQITSDQAFPSQSSVRILHEWILLLDLVMQICNSRQKFGLSLLCFRLFEVALMMSDAVSENQLHCIAHVKQQQQHSDMTLTLLPMLSILKETNEILNTTMVALCGVKLPREAINLHNAVASGKNDGTPRATHDILKYAEHLATSLDSSSYQSWEPAHRHIHRLTGSLAYVEDNQEILSASESILLSSALAVALRECTVTSNPEAAIFLGQWVESRPLIKQSNGTTVLFSDTNEGFGLPVQLTDSLLSAAVEAFAQCDKVRIAERLIQENLGNDRAPSNWLLSYHEAMKMLLSQGQNNDGLALFRTVIASAKNPALFCTVAKSLITSGNWRQVLDLYRQAMSSGCSSEELSLLTMESIVASGRIGQIDGQFPLLRSIISETSKSLGLLPATWIETNYWKFKRVLGFSNARLIMGWDDYKLSRLDELDLAIETLEKRAMAGLTPKNAVLFSIIQAAANLEQYEVPFNATGLPNIPRDTSAWISLIGKALDEAKETRLFYEPNFIFETSMALRRVDQHTECLEIVSDALSRGLKLNKATLENAVLAGQAVGMDYATADIKMLLEGPS